MEVETMNLEIIKICFELKALDFKLENNGDKIRVTRSKDNFDFTFNNLYEFTEWAKGEIN